MYARHFIFKAHPGKRPEVEALADQAFGFMKSLQGFVSAHFLVSEDEGTFGTFSLWESKQAAESAGESLRSKTSDILEKLAAEPPSQRIFEIYKPRT